MKSQILSALFWALLFPTLGWSLTIEVTPQGPVSTLEAARDAARHARDAGEKGQINVRLADGTYSLPGPLVLEPRDSGVTYEAAPGAHPLITGSRHLTGFKPRPDGIWTLQVPDVQQGHWYFEALWINGQRAVRARTPNSGFLNAIAVGDKPIAQPMNGDAGHVLLKMQPKDIDCLRGLSPAELHDVNALAYHTWDVARHRVLAARLEDGTLQFTGGGGYPFFEPERSQRIHLENFRGALDAPGEWFLSRDGLLSYIPRPGENPETAEVWAPVSDRWIVFQGDPKAGQFIENVEFRGLRFQGQQYQLPEAGAAYGQADVPAGAAIEASGTRNIVFAGCEMAHTMNNIAWFRRGCMSVSVTHCWMHDMGAGGVKIGDPAIRDKGVEQCSFVNLDDCIIQHGGRYFMGSMGVTIFNAHDCAIRYCDIADFYYIGINLGWTWGYGLNSASNLIVDHCNIHHLGWNVLSDLAAVYTLGPLPGTVIRNCHIHDISTATYGGWGMYNDEGSEGVIWENNLVHHTKDAAYHMHYGHGCIVRNNILAYSVQNQLAHSRPEKEFAFGFEHNIVLLGTARLFGPSVNYFNDGHIDFHENLYWRNDGHSSGPPREFASRQAWAQWQLMGADTGSILADPKFKDPAVGDWTLAPDSPAYRVGFVPFDWKLAGVNPRDVEWRRLADEPMPAMTFPAPPAPPLTLHEGFEQTPLGTPPAGAEFDVRKGTQLEVVADRPSKGARCLLLTDGPVDPGYNPIFDYRPHHDQGHTQLQFDLRAEPAYRLDVEWRDDMAPYRTGPALHVHDGAIFLPDQAPIPIPADRWTHVQMIAGLGAICNGTWTAIITVPGKPAQQIDNVKNNDPGFRTLEWLGFSSPGTSPARCWLDEIQLENDPDGG